MFPEVFAGTTVVVLTTLTKPNGFNDVRVPIKFLNNVTDTQLGLLYTLALFESVVFFHFRLDLHLR